MGDVSDPPYGSEVAALHRVEVDPPLVGLLGVRPSRVPGMELDGRHLHRPDHAGQLGDAQLVGVSVVAREVDTHRLDPRRRSAGQPLLVNLLAADAGGEAVQHARSLPQRSDDPVADAQVVARQVELGVSDGREVDPVGVGDANRAVSDLELRRW